MVLKSLGVVFLILLIAFLFFLLRIIYWLKSVGQSTGECASDVAEGMTPLLISVVSIPEDPWSCDQYMRPILSSLANLGFNFLGDYAVTEMPTTSFSVWYHAEHRALAVCYSSQKEDEDRQYWVDLKIHYCDKSEVLVTNVASGLKRRCPTWQSRVDLPRGTEVVEMHNELASKALKKPAIEITKETFPSLYEESYRRYIQYLHDELHGISKEDVEHTCQNIGGSHSEESKHQAYLASKIGEMYQYHLYATKKLLGKDARMIEPLNSKALLVYSPTLDAEVYLSYISELLSLPNVIVSQLKQKVERGMSTPELWDLVLNGNITKLALAEAGTLEYPRRLQVFQVSDTTLV